MSKNDELLKQKALNIISNVTSVRNPKRMETIVKIIEMFEETSIKTERI